MSDSTNLDIPLIGAIIISIGSVVIATIAYTRPDITLKHDAKGNINPNEATIDHFLESEDGINFMNKYLNDSDFIKNLDFVKKHDSMTFNNAADASDSSNEKKITIL